MRQAVAASHASCVTTASGHERHGGSAYAPPAAITTCRLPPTGPARTSPLGGPIRFGLASITCVPTKEGWLYLAAVLDLFARKITRWAMRGHMPGGVDRAGRRLLPLDVHGQGRDGQFRPLGHLAGGLKTLPDIALLLDDDGHRKPINAVQQPGKNGS